MSLTIWPAMAYRCVIPAASADWPAGMMRNWLGAGKRFMVYPVRANQLINYVGFVPAWRMGFLAHAGRPTMNVMSEAKRPEDKCVECGHPRSAHHDYATPHCIPPAEHGQPAVACSCLEFAEPDPTSRRR